MFDLRNYLNYTQCKCMSNDKDTVDTDTSATAQNAKNAALDQTQLLPNPKFQALDI